MCNVRILILTGHGLDHEEDKSRQKEKDTVNRKIVSEDLHFADDIALLSSKFNNLREMTGRFTEEAAREGFKLNARKCKTLRNEFAKNRESIVVNDEEVEDVEEFAYFGAIVDKKVEAVRILGTDCTRHEVHYRGCERCGQPEE